MVEGEDEDEDVDKDEDVGDEGEEGKGSSAQVGGALLSLCGGPRVSFRLGSGAQV